MRTAGELIDWREGCYPRNGIYRGGVGIERVRVVGCSLFER